MILFLVLWRGKTIILKGNPRSHVDCRRSIRRRVWRYQRVIRIRKSKDRQHNFSWWPNEEKVHKINDRVTRTGPPKTGGEPVCSGRESNSCSNSGTRRVNLVTNPVISHEWEKDREVFTTSGTYSWSFATQIFHTGQPSHGTSDRKTIEVMTST